MHLKFVSSPLLICLTLLYSVSTVTSTLFPHPQPRRDLNPAKSPVVPLRAGCTALPTLHHRVRKVEVLLLMQTRVESGDGDGVCIIVIGDGVIDDDVDESGRVNDDGVCIIVINDGVIDDGSGRIGGRGRRRKRKSRNRARHIIS